MNYPRPVRDVRGCLYRIDFQNGKSYIGISKFGLQKRIAGHYYDATKRHPKTALHRAMAKYSSASFSAQTLVVSNDFEYLKMLEVAAIRVFGTKVPRGYNMTDGGDGQLGVVFSPETREKIAAKRRGKDFMSPETRKRLAERLRGRVFSEEHRRRLSESGRRRKPYRVRRTSEHNAKIAASHIGKGHTEGTKLKLSEIVKTWWAARADRSMSEEQKKKISVARLAYWARRKAEHAIS